MQDLINKRVSGLEVPGIRKFSNQVANYPGAINLTLGQPDFATPEHIKAAGRLAIEQNQTAYTHNAGLIELRQAVAGFVNEKYALCYDPESEVIITNGASEALDIAFRTILEEGSEVILPAPIYPGYEPLIRLCGAVPVFVDTTKNDFKLSVEMLQEVWSEKTRCVVLPYPSNPIGSIMKKEELVEIAAFLRDQKVFVVSDEIYSELNYSGTHFSIASIPYMKEKSIVINGLSKSHSMTGWRVGYTLAPSYLSQEMLKVHLYNTVCASTISQYAALEAFIHGKDDPELMKKEYQVRRDFVYDRLTSLGFETIKPDGAFYLFPSIKRFSMSSFDFATELLQKEKVAVVPGSAFSVYGEGYIRISYAYSMDLLEEGMNRIERFIR